MAIHLHVPGFPVFGLVRAVAGGQALVVRLVVRQGLGIAPHGSGISCRGEVHARGTGQYAGSLPVLVIRAGHRIRCSFRLAGCRAFGILLISRHAGIENPVSVLLG